MEARAPTPLQESLSPDELDCLRLIAREMIPASEEFNVPGADDPAIIEGIALSLNRDRKEVQRVLALVRSTLNSSGGAHASIEYAVQLARLKLQAPQGFSIVEAVVSRAYYRDDRVLNSIGIETRPPFPKGYDVEQIDGSLLDPVRRRGVIYRDVGE